MSDSADNPLPVRPIDLLAPNINTNLLIDSQLDYYENLFVNLSSSETILKNYKITQQKIKYFWKQWSIEYLLALREREKLLNNKLILVPKPGDVVIVQEENIPRGQWRLARVTNNNINLISENARSMEIKMGNGRVTRRTVSQLFPLEVCDN